MLKLIHTDAVQIAADRQRKEFIQAELHALTDSIQTKGLFHPIVLREMSDGKYMLVAGERRLRAVKDIWALEGKFKYDSQDVTAGFIPYVSLSELPQLEAEEAELEENIQRANITWQERAAAHSRLNILRIKQAEARGEAPPTVATLARELKPESTEGLSDGELGIYQADLRRELIVAKHLDNPLVKGAKNVDEAFKILKREEATNRNRDLGTLVGKTFTADWHKALNTDSLKWLATYPLDGERFDVILTDAPYGMGADEFGDSGGVAAGAHGYNDSPENYAEILRVCTNHLFRIAKDQAHLYWFCDIDNFPITKLSFKAAGWEVFRTPFFWYKRSGMRAPLPDRGPQRKYETILYAIKGKRTTLKMAGDVLEYAPDTNLGVAAQKPVALFEDLLRRSVLPGNSVLDPFAGSGTIFPACHSLKCRATGIELDTASYGIAVKRIEGLRAQQELDLMVGL